MTVEKYDAKLYINTLCRIAEGDLVSARLLWNLGLSAQSIWLLQQSVEKHLKCLWAKDKTFESEDDLEKKLKHDFEHKIEKIFDNLKPEYKDKIISPIWVIALNALRYKGSFGYSYQMFRYGEKFIYEVRSFLKEKKYSSHLEEWKGISMRRRYNYKNEVKAVAVVKSILSLTNPVTKREKLVDRRRFNFIVSNLQ